MFDRLAELPADPLLSLIAAFNADPRPRKIDLGVGVYRTEAGTTPVMSCVKRAEQELADTQATKAYLGPEGDVGFVDAIRVLALGQEVMPAKIAGLQTPGGTGALRLALELYLSTNPPGTIWLGTPTWPVHESMLAGLGAHVRTYPLYDNRSQTAVVDPLAAAVDQAQRGDLFLVQAGCHNPTGLATSLTEWRRAGELFASKDILPLVDLAYHGLGRSLEEDSAGVRHLASTLPRLLLAYSCDKNFGLYRDRVGAVFALCSSYAEAVTVKGNFASLARNMWSMPPDHGAALVRMILDDDELGTLWRGELAAMQSRLSSLRSRLGSFGQIADIDLGRLPRQQGMFALLPLNTAQIARLRDDHGIYMAGSGRINLAGLRESDVPIFVDALRSVT